MSGAHFRTSSPNEVKNRRMCAPDRLQELEAARARRLQCPPVAGEGLDAVSLGINHPLAVRAREDSIGGYPALVVEVNAPGAVRGPPVQEIQRPERRGEGIAGVGEPAREVIPAKSAGTIKPVGRVCTVMVTGDCARATLAESQASSRQGVSLTETEGGMGEGALSKRNGCSSREVIRPRTPIQRCSASTLSCPGKSQC